MTEQETRDYTDWYLAYAPLDKVKAALDIYNKHPLQPKSKSEADELLHAAILVVENSK